MNINDFHDKPNGTTGEHTRQELKAIENEERIERFLYGELNAMEEASLMEELSANDTLRQQAMAQARLIKGMSQADYKLADALRHAQRKHIDRLLKSKKKKGKKQLRMIAAAASIILLTIIGWKIYDYHHTTTMAKAYAKEITLPLLSRGDNDDKIQTELILLVSLAQNENDDEAILQLDRIWQLSKADTYNDYTNYAPYIGWQLAIAHLMKHDKNAAQQILQEMENAYPADTATGQLARKLEKEL